MNANEVSMYWAAAAAARHAVALGDDGEALFALGELEAMAMHSARPELRSRARLTLEGYASGDAALGAVRSAARDAVAGLSVA